MKKVLIIILLSYFPLKEVWCTDNSFYLKFFPDFKIEAASEIKGNAVYSPMEQEVFLWTNLARMAPREFSVMLDTYIKETGITHSESRYFLSLKAELHKHVSSILPLRTNKTLRETSSSHALYSQKTGRIGHDNFDKRFKLTEDNTGHLSFGENCGYFFTDALQFVISMLIDEDIPGLGHRHNILDESFTHSGVSVVPSLEGRYIFIQNFSGE